MGKKLTCKCILCHEDPNDHHICITGTLSPTYPVDSSIVNESLENPFSRLMRGRLDEDSNDKSSSSESMPPHGDIVEVSEDMDAESVDQT